MKRNNKEPQLTKTLYTLRYKHEDTQFWIRGYFHAAKRAKKDVGKFDEYVKEVKKELTTITGREIFSFIDCGNNTCLSEMASKIIVKHDLLEKIFQNSSTYLNLKANPTNQERTTTFLKSLDNEGYFLEMAAKDPSTLETAPFEFRNNEEIIFKLLDKHHNIFFFSPYYRSFAAVAGKLQHKEKFMLSLIGKSEDYYRLVPKKMRTKEFAIKAVEVDPMAIGYMCSAFKQNQDILLTALTRALEIPIDITSNQDKVDYILKNYLKKNPRKANNDLRADDHVPLLFPYASKTITANREIVLIILLYRSYMFSTGVFHKYRNTPLICDLAYFFKYASEDLKNDKEFIKEAIKQNPGVYRHLSKSQKQDRDIFLLTLKKSTNPHKDLQEVLENNTRFLIEALNIYTELYRKLPKRLGIFPRNYTIIWGRISARVTRLSPKEAYFVCRNNSIRVIRDELFPQLKEKLDSLNQLMGNIKQPSHSIANGNNRVYLTLYETSLRQELTRQLDKVETSSESNPIALYDKLARFLRKQVKLTSQITDKKNGMDQLLKYLLKFRNDDQQVSNIHCYN